MQTITPAALKERLANGTAPLIIDVREPDEWEAGHIDAAKLVPLATVAEKVGEVAPDKSAEIVVHCARGGRSAKACAQMEAMGYTNVKNLEGGFMAFEGEGA